MNLSDVTIISSRLKQIPINEEFINDIYINFTADVTVYMYPQPSEDKKNVIEFVKNSMNGIKAGTNLQLVVLKRDTNEFLGCSGLHHIDSDNPELGIWIKKEAHNNSYGLEAISAIIEWAKDNIDYKYFKYPVDKRNIASRRIPESHEGVISKEYKFKNMSGVELDIVEYWIY